MVLYVYVYVFVCVYMFISTHACVHMCLETRRRLQLLGTIPLAPSFPLFSFSFKTGYPTVPNRVDWLA